MPNSPRKTSDQQVIQRILAGDIDEFEILVVQYQKDVMNLVCKHVPYDEIEEIAQDAFIRAYQALPSFNFKSSFKTWLNTITIRTCYEYWRKHYRSREVTIGSMTEAQLQWLEEILSEKDSQSLKERGEQEEAREVLKLALDHLSPEDRIVLELVHLEGKSGKEAATLLGWSLANVKIRSFRSRQKLYKILSEMSNAEKE